MSNLLEQQKIKKVENIIWNMIDGNGYKEETFFEFERINNNKTIFKMKYIELPNKLLKQTFDYVIELVPSVKIYPLNNKQIELRV